MELFLDKNGTYLQRRKMYNGFALHNQKSHLQLDWSGSDLSVQDQIGKRYKLKKQADQIKKKYSQSMQKQYKQKYIEPIENNPHNRKVYLQSINPFDSLNQEIQQFNTSKIISPRIQIGKQLHNSRQMPTVQWNQPYNDKNNTALYQNQINPEIYPRETNAYLPHNHKKSQNYQTLSPVINHQYRRKQYQKANVTYRDELQTNPGKFVQKMYTGSAPIQYPFRNVIPDKLQNHLRQKAKQDHRRYVKVNLNLFDYYTKAKF